MASMETPKGVHLRDRRLGLLSAGTARRAEKAELEVGRAGGPRLRNTSSDVAGPGYRVSRVSCLEVCSCCCCDQELSVFVRPECWRRDLCVPALPPTPGRATAHPLRPAPRECHPRSACLGLGHGSTSLHVPRAHPTPEPSRRPPTSLTVASAPQGSSSPRRVWSLLLPSHHPWRQPPVTFPSQPLGGSVVAIAGRLPLESAFCL